jgi:hypothetical protein
MRILPILVAILMLTIACGGDISPANTSTSTLVSQSAAATTVPAPLPTAPADWPTYTDHSGLFSLQYPTDWTQNGAAFYSYDPTSSFNDPRPDLPPDVVKVEVSASPVWGGGCSPVSLEPTTGEIVEVSPDAVETTLGGQPAWRFSNISALDGTTKILGVVSVYGDTCTRLTAYDTRDEGDTAFFDQMIQSFEFHFTPPEQWPTYESPVGNVSLIYPPDWFETEGVITSRDPGAANAAEGTTIDVSVTGAAGLDMCGSVIGLTPNGGLYFDLNSMPPNAIETTIGEESGWQLTYGGSSNPEGYEYGLIHDGYCVLLDVNFGDEPKGGWSFDHIWHSFELNF